MKNIENIIFYILGALFFCYTIWFENDPLVKAIATLFIIVFTLLLISLERLMYWQRESIKQLNNSCKVYEEIIKDLKTIFGNKEK